MPPTYVPVIRTGIDVEFADVTVTGALAVAGAAAFADTLTVTGNLTGSGYTALQAGQYDGQLTLWSDETSALRLGSGGGGIALAEGANARMGVATLVAGTVTVANTSVTAATRVFLTSQADGGTPGAVRVSARTAGVSFTITSTSAADTSTVAYLLVEPA